MRVIAEIVIGHFLGYLCYLMFEGPARSLLRPVTGEFDPLRVEPINKVTGTTTMASATSTTTDTTTGRGVSAGTGGSNPGGNTSSTTGGGGGGTGGDVNANLNAKKAN